MLGQRQHVEVVGEAADGREALCKAREMLPDIVLMDIEMPRMNGLEAADALRKELPQVKVLILSMYQHPGFVSRVIDCGARGYLLKEALSEELFQAIDTVNGGQAYFSPEIARIALNGFLPGKRHEPEQTELSKREREVLMQIAEGYTNKEIARNLSLGVRTIETHRERLMCKLRIRSVAGLTRFALTNGMTTLRASVRR